MKRVLKILAVPFLLFILYIIVLLCIEFFYILEPSVGIKIDHTRNPNSIILVIDVQNKFTHWDNAPKARKLGIDSFLNNINRVIKKTGAPEAVFIRQEFSKNSLLSYVLPMFPEEGDPGTDINMNVYIPGSKIITKSKADAFTNPALQEYLNSRKTGTIYITGLAAEACVDNTIRGALAKEYRVFVIKESILSINGGEPEQKRIEKYKSYGAQVVSINDLYW